jgi:hypothetical protein
MCIGELAFQLGQHCVKAAGPFPTTVVSMHGRMDPYEINACSGLSIYLLSH